LRVPETRLWRRPIVRVLVLQLAAMAWLGPLQRWLSSADLHGCGLTVNIVTAAGVTLLLLRAGRAWQVTGPAPRGHLWQAILWIALATAYFALRTRRWREPSLLVLRDCVEVTLVATFEELIWRGWVLGTLRARYGMPIAVAASSVLFGLAHTTHLAHGTGVALVAVKVAWTSFCGVFFAGVLLASRNYWMPIAAHAVNCIATMGLVSFPWRLRDDWDLLVAGPLLALVGWHLCRVARKGDATG
jgi:membrane protease YdiL (CAAX protease family)